MKEIFKTLIKYKWKILLVLVLITIQAYCDLSLPTYTSNIVDIGIQQGGLETYVPDVIRESEYNKVLFFLNKEEQDILNDSYIYIERENEKYTEEYKVLETEGVYILDKENENLESILLYPLAILSSQANDENTSSNSTLTGPEIVDEFRNKYEGNESFLFQANIAYIKGEYSEVGLDLDKIQMSYIYKTGAKMLTVALIAMVITIYTVYTVARIAAYFSKDLRKKVVNKVMTFESEEMKNFSTASLITRCTNDINQIQMLITVFLRTIIYAPIVGFGAITKVSGSTMGWVILVSVLAILSLMIIIFVVVVPKVKKFQDLLDRLNLVSRETLTGLSVIRAFANERHEEKRFEVANNDLTKNGLFINRVMAIMAPTLTFIMNSVSILIVWVGAEKIDAGTMQVGTMIAFISYSIQIIMAFLMVSMVAIMLPRAAVSIKRLSEVLNTEIKVKDKEKTEKFPSDIIGEVEFKDVYFRYPEAKEDVLRNISFKATKGTITAFIGSTGSGKSTLINLIPRFFDVTGGKILIDGKNIKDVSIKSLRDKIGYVPQKGQLFTGTIKSNIAFGMNKLNDDKIKEAAKISQSLEFIEEDPDKFEREISQGGTNVSGGQRQRLAIARAIAKDPEIYIFDDSFSALDYKTDAMLRKELNKTIKNKTVLIVAQRISSVMHADQIIVLNEGEIVGIGTHEELLKTCEVYKEIKVSQLGGED